MPGNRPNAHEILFPGGGEMGARLRAHDWAATSLGPVEAWPPSLTTAVRIMLGSRFAMWMAWGPDLTFFCNDAYKPTLGVKEAWALGSRSDVVWAEIWPDIGPRIAQVLRTGQATWDEALLLFLERRGFTEESYHTFSYSPLADESGTVTGMLCVVSEETERVIGERRLRCLRDLGPGWRQPAPFRRSEPWWPPASGRAPATCRWRSPIWGRRAGPAGPGGTGVRSPGRRAGGGGRCGRDGASRRRRPESGGRRRSRPPLRRAAGRPLGPAPHPCPGRADRPAGPGPAGRGVRRGFNPYRPLDEEYRGFVDLFVGQIATGLANANAYEAERRRAEAFAELDRQKTVFFSNVSHEFRTPLTLMLGPLTEVLDCAPASLDPDTRRLVELAHRNGLRLLKLVNALLDFSRIEAGRAQAAFEPLDLARFTAELASSFRSATDKAGLVLDVDCVPLPEPAFVDPDMWEKVVLNLVSNAFKFTLRGRIAVRLGAQGGGRCCRWPIPASASRRPSCRGCSSASTGSRARRGAASRDRASGSPWSRSWSGCMAARSGSRALWARAAPSR